MRYTVRYRGMERRTPKAVYEVRCAPCYRGSTTILQCCRLWVFNGCPWILEYIIAESNLVSASDGIEKSRYVQGQTQKKMSGRVLKKYELIPGILQRKNYDLYSFGVQLYHSIKHVSHNS